jgi:hypothetical protein
MNLMHEINQRDFALDRRDYADAANRATCTLSRPSYVFKPKVFLNGNMWCALYGENIQEGVCSFGNSPANALREFDRAWDAVLENK